MSKPCSAASGTSGRLNASKYELPCPMGKIYTGLANGSSLEVEAVGEPGLGAFAGLLVGCFEVTLDGVGANFGSSNYNIFCFVLFLIFWFGLFCLF